MNSGGPTSPQRSRFFVTRTGRAAGICRLATAICPLATTLWSIGRNWWPMDKGRERWPFVSSGHGLGRAYLAVRSHPASPHPVGRAGGRRGGCIAEPAHRPGLGSWTPSCSARRCSTGPRPGASAPLHYVDAVPDWMHTVDPWVGATACLALWWRRRYPLGLAVAMVLVLALAVTGFGAALIAVLTVAVHRNWLPAALVTALHLLPSLLFGYENPPPGVARWAYVTLVCLMYLVPLAGGSRCGPGVSSSPTCAGRSTGSAANISAGWPEPAGRSANASRARCTTYWPTGSR